MVLLSCFRQRENIVAEGCTLYSSLIIVISLQLRGCRQITEPHKYCLIHVIVFLWHVFFSIFVSHRLGIQLNSLQLVSEPRVRFE